MISLATKLEQLDGLRDTNDLTDWETGFVTNILETYLLKGKKTSWMSEKQVATLERIYEKHFA